MIVNFNKPDYQALIKLANSKGITLSELVNRTVKDTLLKGNNEETKAVHTAI